MAAFAYQKIFIHSFSHSSEMHMWQHSSEKFGTNKFISYKKKLNTEKKQKKNNIEIVQQTFGTKNNLQSNKTQHPK